MSYSAEESSPLVHYETCCVCDEEFSSEGELTDHLIKHTGDAEFKDSLLEFEQKKSAPSTPVSSTSSTNKATPTSSITPSKRTYNQRSTSPEVLVISDDSGDEGSKSKAPKLSNVRSVSNTNSTSNGLKQPVQKTSTLGNAVYGASNALQQKNVQRSNVQQNNVQRSSVQQNVQRPNVQQSNVQRSNVQQNNVQRSNVQQNSVQRSNVQQNSVQRSNVQQNYVQRSNVQQNNVQRSNVQQNNVQRSNVQQHNVSRPNDVQKRSNVQQNNNQGAPKSTTVQQPVTNTRKSFNGTPQAASSNVQKPQSSSGAVSKGPPYDCQICNKVFQDTNSYREHMQTHAKKAFSCHICNKSFAFEPTLRDHLLKHIGEKSHECKKCHMKFSMKNILVRHEKVCTSSSVKKVKK